MWYPAMFGSRKHEDSKFEFKRYVGYDIVFGALIGLFFTVRIGKREWGFAIERDFDGRAPLYFKSKKAYLDQMNTPTQSGSIELKDCFYL